MKKTVLSLVTLICFSGLHAQYKKASFFEKEGRTYGITGEAHFLGDGRKTAPGVRISFGRESIGRHMFSNTEIRVLPSFKFAYATRDMNADPVIVSGQSKLHLTYGMNWGFYILKNEEEKKVLPYVTAGFNIVILGGLKKFDDEESSYDVLKRVPLNQFSSGLGGGAGVLFNVNSWLGLKLEGGYTYQFNISTDYDSGYELYYMYVPHPYASLGVRFRVLSE